MLTAKSIGGRGKDQGVALRHKTVRPGEKAQPAHGQRYVRQSMPVGATHCAVMESRCAPGKVHVHSSAVASAFMSIFFNEE